MFSVFSSLFSDLFHRKKLDTATCIITAILGYNNQKKMNTFNKIKTFKYSKIFAWKYKTTQKALKSNLNSCLEEKKKKAEVLGHFSRTYHTSTSIAQWWKHCCIWGFFASVWEKLCLFWLSVCPRWVCTWLQYFVLPLLKKKSRWASVAFCPSLTSSTCSTKTNTPTNPESAALLLAPTDVIFFFFCQRIEEKEKARHP